LKSLDFAFKKNSNVIIFAGSNPRTDHSKLRVRRIAREPVANPAACRLVVQVVRAANLPKRRLQQAMSDARRSNRKGAQVFVVERSRALLIFVSVISFPVMCEFERNVRFCEKISRWTSLVCPTRTRQSRFGFSVARNPPSPPLEPTRSGTNPWCDDECHEVSSILTKQGSQLFDMLNFHVFFRTGV
jgi:hypothetical protein